MTPDRILFTPQEVAKQLRISVRTLREHVDTNNIDYVVIGLGKIRQRIAFRQKDIDSFVSRQTNRRPSLGD